MEKFIYFYDILSETKLSKSKSEAKRELEQGQWKINKIKISVNSGVLILDDGTKKLVI